MMPTTPPSHARPACHVMPRHTQPQDAYGLEKLASEELAKHYGSDFGMETRIARFHNIYGPFGTWKARTQRAACGVLLCAAEMRVGAVCVCVVWVDMCADVCMLACVHACFFVCRVAVRRRPRRFAARC
jgi:nucleoside-diphosphate-sugar epimerase